MSANLLRKYSRKLPLWLMRFLGNCYPPFWAAGIHIDRISPDFREIDIGMKLHWYNKNYVGTHFGGSLYAMTDPFYMMILIENLGPGYIVWDKGAKIDFKKPGTGKVKALFRFSEQEIAAVKAQADTQEKYIFDRPVDITNEAGEVVAAVTKTLYVKKKTKEQK
ncbi:MAG: DUF4442 domain-containing protein [Bdellovibrionota bacterium]